MNHCANNYKPGIRDFRESVNVLEFYDEIKRCLKNDDFPVDGDLPDPVKWADMLNDDEDFRKEFDRIYQDKDIPEADDVFTP